MELLKRASDRQKLFSRELFNPMEDPIIVPKAKVKPVVAPPVPRQTKRRIVAAEVSGNEFAVEAYKDEKSKESTYNVHVSNPTQGSQRIHQEDYATHSSSNDQKKFEYAISSLGNANDVDVVISRDQSRQEPIVISNSRAAGGTHEPRVVVNVFANDGDVDPASIRTKLESAVKQVLRTETPHGKVGVFESERAQMHNQQTSTSNILDDFSPAGGQSQTPLKGDYSPLTHTASIAHIMDRSVGHTPRTNPTQASNRAIEEPLIKKLSHSRMSTQNSQVPFEDRGHNTSSQASNSRHARQMSQFSNKNANQITEKVLDPQLMKKLELISSDVCNAMVSKERLQNENTALKNQIQSLMIRLSRSDKPTSPWTAVPKYAAGVSKVPTSVQV